MRHSAYTVAMVALLALAAVAVGAGAFAAPALADEHEASVTFTESDSGGETLTVDEVTVPDGGFVTIHDDTLTDGAVLGSVVGTSGYLEPGTHENVTVHLDDEIADGTLHAMAHRDTNGDRAYTFVSSNGEADGPYTVDGDIVMDDAAVTVSATVSFSGQDSEGEYVIVDRAELSEGGFVTVHDSSLLDSAVFESVRGTSAYLEAGVHEDIRIQLDEPLENDDTLLPMAHRDTNDNQAYDFTDSEGEADGPFVTAGGNAVLDDAQVELSDDAYTRFSAQASGGTTVVVDEVFVPDGGFVTMHDSSLADGAVFESIRGTSAYLEPGIHRDVVVTLEDPLAEDDTVFAMAHRDTDDDRAYSFPATDGEADGPYTVDGDIVMDDGDVTVAASVSLDGQTADGTTVVVDSVDLAEGGFVTIHDASLQDGAVLDSVRGTSAYLEPGAHEDVEITLDAPLTETNQVLAMAHRDTNDNQAYDFVETEGDADGPYVADGDIVMDGATISVSAFVSADAEASDGETIVVENVTLHDGGFVTVHDSTLVDGEVIGSIRGTSAYLAPGTHETVDVTLDEPLENDDTVFAMAHRDTNDNQAYDFVESEGGADGPYVAAASPVMDSIDVMVQEMNGDDDGMNGDDEDDGMNGDDEDDGMNSGDDETNGDDGMDGDDGMNDEDDGMDGDDDGMDSGDDRTSDDAADDDGPGFGVLAALVALVAAGLLVLRRRT